MTEKSITKIQVELDNVFKLVNDWLKYAEQKLTGLIVLNGGILWGYSRLMNTHQASSDISTCLNALAYSLVILALIICIVSTMPVLNKRWFISKVKSENDSSIFFGDIQKYSHYEYLQLLNSRTGLNQQSFSEYEKDQAKQIVYNAEIATSKFVSARFASWITLIAICVFTVAFLTIYYG